MARLIMHELNKRFDTGLVRTFSFAFHVRSAFGFPTGENVAQPRPTLALDSPHVLARIAVLHDLESTLFARRHRPYQFIKEGVIARDFVPLPLGNSQDHIDVCLVTRGALAPRND